MYPITGSHVVSAKLGKQPCSHCQSEIVREPIYLGHFCFFSLLMLLLLFFSGVTKYNIHLWLGSHEA